MARDQLAQSLLSEDGRKTEPDRNSSWLRDGPRPQAHRFPTLDAEQSFVAQEIKSLLARDVRAREIAVLHTKPHVVKRYSALLRTCGHSDVACYEATKQTGLQYSAVFIPQLHQILEREVGTLWEEDRSRQLCRLHMMMTRPRTWLYLLYERAWPKEMEPVRRFVDFVEHS